MKGKPSPEDVTNEVIILMKSECFRRVDRRTFGLS